MRSKRRKHGSKKVTGRKRREGEEVEIGGRKVKKGKKGNKIKGGKGKGKKNNSHVVSAGHKVVQPVNIPKNQWSIKVSDHFIIISFNKGAHREA